MSKFLLLLGIGVVIWLLWRVRRAGGPESLSARDPAPEKMVQCAQCGVYLPLSDSVGEEPRNYCCEAHRQLGARDLA